MNKEDDKKKEIHLDLKTILELDTPQLEPSNNKLELNDNDKLELEGYSSRDKESEIKLKQALDILKSLKPNDELINAINLIESVLKREN